MKYLVSACLAGESCRYDGTHCADPLYVDMKNRGEALPVCPELLGGLGIPRSPCEIRNGRVISIDGDDRTEAFMKGAEHTVRLAREEGAVCAVLKNNSPSCGFGSVYDGTFTGKLVPGLGVAAEALSREGLFLFNDTGFTAAQTVRLRKIREKEYDRLVAVSTESFLSDSLTHSPCGAGGPEGFDSVEWHREASGRGRLLVITYNNELAGGLFVTLKPDKTGWINRIFVRSDLRGKGIGRRVFFLLEQKYSSIREWGLDTPDWAHHNQRFYESMGYKKTREIYSKEAGFYLVVLKKRCILPKGKLKS